MTIGQFIDNGGGAAVGGTSLFNSTFNTVSLEANGLIAFEGVLSNGETLFSGNLSISAATTLTDLISTIQTTIDAAEAAIGINTVGGTAVQETNVQVNPADGRLQFFSGDTGSLSRFDLNLTFLDAADAVLTRQGITRSDTVANSELGADATGALIGNSLTAITGSTFDTGQFEIEITNVLTAEQRTLEAESGFFTDVSLTAPAAGGDFLRNTFLGAIDIDNGDEIQFSGTNPDGSTFSTTITVVNPPDPQGGNGQARSIDDLIAELNFRDQTAASFGFTGATATFAGGRIQVIDDISQESLTDFTFTVNDVSAPGTSETVDPTVLTEGREQTASVQIADGTSQTVSAGQVATVTGGVQSASGQSAAEITFRLGPTLTEGTDRLDSTAELFQGSLSNGPTVTFSSGQNGVLFFSGADSPSSLQTFQSLSIDFDSILDITSSPDAGGETFQLTSTSDSLQFRIGGNRNDDSLFFLADLRPDNLGLNASETVDDINVTTLDGASRAIEIVDAALDQVNAVNSRLGAFSSRLQDSVNQLTSNSLGLETAYNQIVSADIAAETNELAINTVLLEAQSAVLAQANNSADRVFSILYGLDS